MRAHAGGLVAGGLLILIVELSIEMGKLPDRGSGARARWFAGALELRLTTAILGLLVRAVGGQSPVAARRGSGDPGGLSVRRPI